MGFKVAIETIFCCKSNKKTKHF